MKKINKSAVVFFSYSAFVKIIIEMQKFFRIGLKKDNRPWEATSHPLGFVKSKTNKSPFQILNLSEIDSFVITHALFPDEKLTNYSSSRATFKEGINEDMRRKISPLLLKYPKLDFGFRLHSHPNGSRFLSNRDKKFTLSILDQQQETGLNTNIHFLVTCDKKSWESISSWQIFAYAIDEFKNFISLPIEFIYQNNFLFKEALNEPFYKNKKNYFWLNRLINFFANDYKVEFCELYRGWASCCFFINNIEFHICFPPNFPINTNLEFVFLGKETRIIKNPELASLIIESYNDLTIEDELKNLILTLKT